MLHHKLHFINPTSKIYYITIVLYVCVGFLNIIKHRGTTSMKKSLLVVKKQQQKNINFRLNEERNVHNTP